MSSTSGAASVVKRMPGPGVVAGDVLGGRYQLLVPMASGGMGSVWAARQIGQHRLHSLVAVKIAHAQFANTEKFEHMFLDEAHLASAIRHPNVCSVFDLGRDHGTLYLVMEWIGGGSLHELLGSVPGRRLDCRIAARIIVSACAGLHAAHELRDSQGQPLELIHRDVSPQNILLTTDGQVKLTDFGVARAKGQLHQTTSTGEVKGKLSYMAPEQFGSRSYDRRVDVFSLGCVLYRAVVGTRAFDGTGAEILYSLMHLEFDRPRAVVPEIPEEVERIVLRAMAKLEDRYASAKEMADDLEAWLAAQPPCTDADVAAIVRSSLNGIIEDRNNSVVTVQGQIDSGLLNTRAESKSPSDPTELVTPTPNATQGANKATAEPVTDGPLVQHLTKVSPPPRGMAIFALVLCVGILGGATAWRELRRASTPDPVPAAASATVLAVTSAPIASSPTPSASVHVSVESNVAGASLSIDDGPPHAMPFQDNFPQDKGQHVVRVWAAGHRVETRTLVFDGPRLDLFVPLAPVASAIVAASPPTQPAVKTTRPGPSPQPTPQVAEDAFGKTLTAPVGPKRKQIDTDDPFKN